jgi:hypothetical protein
LKEATGKDIDIEKVGRNAFGVEASTSGMSQMGLMLSQSYQDYTRSGNNGEESLIPDEFEKVLGAKLTSLPDAIMELDEEALR